MKRKIKLGFADTYDNAKNFFTEVLGTRYDVTIDNKYPEYLIFGDRNFGYSHLEGNFVGSKKIFFTGENVRPYWSECQYAISFDHENSSRHYRLPLWVLEMWAITKDNNPLGVYTFDTLKTLDRVNLRRHFGLFGAAYVQSNPNQPFRNKIAGWLAEANLLYSAGPHYNNTGYILPRDRSLKFDFYSKYLFGMAIENGAHPGYVTEKLIDSYYSGTIPIYWGSKTVARDFNPESMIILKDDITKDELYTILNEYQDPVKVKEKLAQPVFNDNVLPDVAQLEIFLDWWDRWVI